MIKTLTLEYHSPEGGFTVFRNTAAPSDREQKPIEERALEAFKGELEASSIKRVWAPGHSLATTEEVQFRGVFYDVEQSDRETLEALFASLFPDTTSSEFLASPESAHAGLVAFVLDSGPPFDVWLSWPKHASRLTGIHYSVPEWALDIARFQMSFRRVRIMVFGGACLVFFLREASDLDQADEAIANQAHAVEGHARGVYSTGADNESPGDIANRYVSALLSRTDEGTLRIEEALEEWEVDYYSSVIGNASGSTTPDVESLRRIRAATAEIRTQIENLNRRELQHLNDWRDYKNTRKSLSKFNSRISEIQERLQGQRTGVQDALSLVATASTAGLLRIAEEGRQQSERLQRMGVLITSFVLVPGLLATLYASGIEVPGGASTSQRTAWLGALMLLGASATVFLISLYERGARTLAWLLSLVLTVVLVGIFLLCGSSPAPDTSSDPRHVQSSPAASRNTGNSHLRHVHGRATE
jgi:hypothetical protein